MGQWRGGNSNSSSDPVFFGAVFTGALFRTYSPRMYVA